MTTDIIHRTTPSLEPILNLEVRETVQETLVIGELVAWAHGLVTNRTAMTIKMIATPVVTCL